MYALPQTHGNALQLQHGKMITLTEEQARNAMQLIDLAVKAGGLNAAALALPIARSIEDQLVATHKQEAKE
jgi:hypothetical protein